MAEEVSRPLTAAELEDLPVLSVIMDGGEEPHAWQKRRMFTRRGDIFLWYATSDLDWGYVTGALLRDHGGFTLLWTPQR